MQPLATGGLAEGGEAQPLQPLPHLLRRRDHPSEGHVLGGIEVKDEPVGVLDIVCPGAPGVDLRHPHLRQRNQPLDAVDGEVGRALASHGHLPDQMGETRHGMSLEETLGADAVRRAEQRDRPTGDMRQQARGHGLVVGRQITLGDALLRPEQLVRVAQPNAGDNARAAWLYGALAGPRPAAAPRPPLPACPRGCP